MAIIYELAAKNVQKSCYDAAVRAVKVEQLKVHLTKKKLRSDKSDSFAVMRLTATKFVELAAKCIKLNEYNPEKSYMSQLTEEWVCELLSLSNLVFWLS